MVYSTNPIIVAEIGCVHDGSLDRAKCLADLAKKSGADILKTQKRNPKESVKKELWDQPHENKLFARGDTYLEHRENLELNQQQHAELKSYCEKIGITYSTSVWDMTSAKEIIELNPTMIKIPSACNYNFKLIQYIIDNYTGELHVSTGMITRKEKQTLFDFLTNRAKGKVVVYHCTSGYPVPFEQIYLKEISGLVENFEHVGFSNHGYGIAMEPAAYALGATYFERHFTDDRAGNFTDARNSLEPQGLAKLCRDLKALHKALHYKPEKLEEIELVQRRKLRAD